jgi:hypothetical protein
MRIGSASSPLTPKTWKPYPCWKLRATINDTTATGIAKTHELFKNMQANWKLSCGNQRKRTGLGAMSTRSITDLCWTCWTCWTATWCWSL